MPAVIWVEMFFLWNVKAREVSSGSFLDNVFRRTRSPELCMSFEPSGSTASQRFFTPSPASSWGEKPSASPHWAGGFHWSRSKESDHFDSFENPMNHSRVLGGSRSGGSHRSESPFCLYQPLQRLQTAARPAHCPRDQVPFESVSCCLAPSPAQLQPLLQQSHFQTFHQTAPPLSRFPHTSHLTDMDVYPPSYVVDKGLPPYFPSLEPWSFPPMRLY